MIPAVAIDVAANVIFEARDIFFPLAKNSETREQRLPQFAMRLGMEESQGALLRRRQNCLAESWGLALVGLGLGLGGASCDHGVLACC